VSGWDCPWYADKRTGICSSEVLVDKHEIYRTAKECCEVQFAGSSTCEYDSMAVYGHPSNAAWPPWAPQMGNYFDVNPQKYFPDWLDNNNCILGKTYDDWMMEDGFSDFYLFDDGLDCCKMW
jgi:hypothetical protein